MGDTNMWTVIQFVEDGTVEAVPTNWIQGNNCHWPSYSRDKLVNSIKKNEPLNTCWPSHVVKIFRNATYDNYMKARIKAKQAEVTSDLNTESDDETNRNNRKRIQRTLSTSEESVEESILPQPPKISKFKKQTVNTLKDVSLELTEMVEASGIANLNKGDINLQADPDPVSDYQYHFIPAPPACPNCSEKDKTFKILTQQGHILRGLITDTLSELRALRKDIGKTNKDPETTNFFGNPDLHFPMSTDEDFQHLEIFLTNKEDFNKATIELSKLGGSSNYDFVRRSMKLFLSNESALKYSWLGRKGKRSFQNTLLAKLITNSAETANLARSQKDTEISMQLWLRRASDRRISVRESKKF